MLIKHPWPPYQPKIPAVPHLCTTCPFQPGGNGHGAGHPDFAPGGDILTRIELGVVFPCHETVIMDPRTRYTGKGPDRQPVPDQKHFRHCLGAVLYKMRQAARPRHHRGIYP